MDDVGHFLPHFTVPGTFCTKCWRLAGVDLRDDWLPPERHSVLYLYLHAQHCGSRLHCHVRQGSTQFRGKEMWQIVVWMFGRCLEYFVEDHTTILNLDKMPGHEEFLVSSLWVTQRRSGNWGSVKELTLWQCPQVTSSSWRTVSLACCWLSSNLPVRSRIQPVALVSHHQPKLRMGTYYII